MIIVFLLSKWKVFVSLSYYLRIKVLLLQFGANPNCLTHGAQMTPLMLSCLIGSTLATTALIEHGAQIDAYDVNRTTALMHAASNGNDECVRALLDAGGSWHRVCCMSVCV